MIQNSLIVELNANTQSSNTTSNENSTNNDNNNTTVSDTLNNVNNYQLNNSNTQQHQQQQQQQLKQQHNNNNKANVFKKSNYNPNKLNFNNHFNGTNFFNNNNLMNPKSFNYNQHLPHHHHQGSIASSLLNPHLYHHNNNHNQSYVPFATNANGFASQTVTQQSSTSTPSSSTTNQTLTSNSLSNNNIVNTVNSSGANFIPNYFYSTNTYSTKQSYMNHRNYIKAKKEQNMHKLWPHSVQSSSKGETNELSNNQATSSSSSDVTNPPNQQTESNLENEQSKQSGLDNLVSTTDTDNNNNNNNNNKQDDTSNTNTSELKNDESTNQATNNTNAKTPMCLINELVKFNKIKHEYVLLDEIGPAHKKKFFVMLKLGVGTPELETYQANGTSIKKAQHEAAELALKQTKYKRPVPRPKKKPIDPNTNNLNSTLTTSNYPNNRSNYRTNNGNLKKPNQNQPSPTVLLNSFCMKFGLRANYEHSTSTTNVNVNSNQVTSPLIIEQPNNLSNQSNNDNSPSTTATTSPTSNITANNAMYTNFNNSDYKPFIYPPAQLYLSRMPTSNSVSSPTTTATSSLNTPNHFKKNFNRINRYNNYNNGGMFSQQSYSQINQTFTVKLKIADYDFQAEANNLQLAKHNAASKALEFFSKPENITKAKQFVQTQYSNAKQIENIKLVKSSNGDPKPNDSNDSVNQNSLDLSAKDKLETDNISKLNVVSKPTEQKITILTRNKSNEENVKKSTSIDENSKNNDSNKEIGKKLKSSISEDTTSRNELTDKQSNSSNDQTKSEISILHEYAYRLKKTVSFELVQESGPSHIKKFVTKCSVGTKPDLTTSTNNQTCDQQQTVTDQAQQLSYFEILGEGNSKKLSKRNSAIEMLKILKEKFSPDLFVKPEINKSNTTDQLLQANTTQIQQMSKKKNRKQKAKNIVKIKKTSPEYGKGSINPISRLIQIQQAKKEPEPTFELISSTNRFKKNDVTRSRNEFLMNVSLKTLSGEILKCEGKGSTKKLAKQNAAEAMLVKLGFPSRAQSNLKPVLKNTAQTNPLSTSSNQVSSTNEASISSDSSSNDIKESANNNNLEKNEKRVKFLDDNELKNDEDNDNDDDTDKSNPNKPKKSTRLNANTNRKQVKNQSNSLQKIRMFKDQLTANNQQSDSSSNSDSNTFRTYLDKQSMLTVYKIADELLESIKSGKNEEFCSKTGDQILNNSQTNEEKSSVSETNSNSNANSHTVATLNAKDFDDLYSEEKKLRFKILNNGNEINYKGALDYLTSCMNFKYNCQSILGRDGSVNSYLTLSILSETDKPFSGQGSTFIESSNAAALNALKYLSKQLNK